jgi:hypothetical protein
VQILIIALLTVHGLSGVFWAGSTFLLARNGEAATGGLFRSQMGAATLVLLTGIGLMAVLRPAGPMGKTLAVGAACAIIAAGLQGVLRKSSPVRAQRLAAVLLGITVVSMVIARYVG